MKKYIYFIALLALCCVFLIQVGHLYASTIYSDDFDILTDGTYALGSDIYAHFPDDYNSCTIATYEGVWGTETEGDLISATGWPCYDYSATYALIPPGTIPTENGEYSLKYSDTIVGDIFVFTFYVLNEMTYDIVPSQVYISSPASGSTATNTATYLVGGWANIDSSFWETIKLSWQSEKISASTTIVDIEISADYGSFNIQLDEWNFSDTNGRWDLNVVVQNQPFCYWYPEMPEEEQCLFNPVEYIEYYLVFDVEGWETPYAFADFETWYSENVDDYEAPSAWAVSLTGFLNPIFEKIGEFGNKINIYLDVSTAYEKGNQIGAIFPVIGAYISKIDLFFGGFPLVQFFKWGILIMFGLFSVKMIFKLLSLIPFIGGG